MVEHKLSECDALGWFPNTTTNQNRRQENLGVEQGMWALRFCLRPSCPTLAGQAAVWLEWQEEWREPRRRLLQTSGRGQALGHQAYRSEDVILLKFFKGRAACSC